MTPGRPRAGWKAWIPEEGTDPFYVGNEVATSEHTEPQGAC